MFRIFFLATLIVSLISWGHLRSKCLFCECEHTYEVQEQKTTFSGTKRVHRLEHVCDIAESLSANRCSLCMSCDHKVINIKKCEIEKNKEPLVRLCQRCLKNSMLPATSYELMLNDSISIFVCGKCEHDIGMHI